VLFSIGLTFMAVAAVDYVMGSQQVNVQTPEWLRGRIETRQRCLDAGHGPLPAVHHRVCVALALGLQAVLARTRFGSRCARRWTTRVWPPAWASRSTACSC
jgi:branched-chain amino acid transport system permease protein